MKVSKYLLFLFMVLLQYSCTTEPSENQKNFTSYQIPGCNNQNFGLSKAANNDSCFVYNFNDTLKIDFCVMGNCCPDSERFATTYEIKLDTIFVSVSDIAPDECDCICNYTIHLEFTDLQREKYLFYCDYENFEYREYVSK